MLETEHMGHRITYSENMEKWSCSALGLDAEKLGALKLKIADFERNERRIDPVPVIFVGESSYPAVQGEKAEVTLIQKGGKVKVKRHVVERRDTYRKNDDGSRIFAEHPAVKRESVELSKLALDNDANGLAIQRWRVLRTEADAAIKLAKDAMEAIPRVTVADLRGITTEDEAVG